MDIDSLSREEKIALLKSNGIDTSIYEKSQGSSPTGAGTFMRTLGNAATFGQLPNIMGVVGATGLNPLELTNQADNMGDRFSQTKEAEKDLIRQGTSDHPIHGF